MRSYFVCAATKATFRPGAQRGLLSDRHTRLPTLPAIQGKGLPTILPIRLIPATDRIIIEIEKLRDLRAAFSIIQQQKSIRTSPNPVILTLATNTAFQLKPVFGGEENGGG